MKKKAKVKAEKHAYHVAVIIDASMTVWAHNKEEVETIVRGLKIVYKTEADIEPIHEEIERINAFIDECDADLDAIYKWRTEFQPRIEALKA